MINRLILFVVAEARKRTHHQPATHAPYESRRKTVEDILRNVPENRSEAFNKLHAVIVKNLPKGFEPAISSGGLGYVVPQTRYFKGGLVY